MGESGAKPGPAGQLPARARARLLEYAAGCLAPSGGRRGGLSGLLEQVTAATGVQGALIVAPGSARPLGEPAYPADIGNDLVLLAQIRSAWAAYGPAAAATGQPFTADLDSGQHHTSLLVVPGEPGDAQRPCALALIGDTSRWGTGTLATLKAVATIAGALPGRDGETSPDGPAYAGPEYITPPAGPARRDLAFIGQSPSGEATGPSGPSSPDSLAGALAAGSPAAVVTIDADRRIREFNPAAEALFGRSRAEVIGLDMPETLVPERLRPHFVDAMAGYLAAGNPGEFASRIRLRALRSDGTERPIELTPLPVTVGEGTFLLGFVRDASDLEAAATAVAEGEARFRLLSDLTPVGIVQTDIDGEVRFVNDKWCQMSGIRAEQVIGENWRFTINPEDVRRIDVSRGEDETEVATDCRLRTAGGGELWVHAVVRRVLDADGNLTGRVAALTDVSARKQAETAGEQDRRQLAAQNVQLRDLNQARVRYLATVSHELRTPLTSIVSFAELIRSDSADLGEEGGDYLDIIQRNAERLLRVVGDLLDLSSLEEGVAQLDLAPVSVPWVTRESVRMGWSIAAVDGVRLDISLQDGPDVQADAARLQQVLDNLISNAVKFSSAGSRVEVRASHDSREWRVDVADAGIGIPSSEVDHLFDRFFRASNAREAAVPGTGLGLPTAKAITELHGGRIEVASTIGSGTTFTVVLPIGP